MASSLLQDAMPPPPPDAPASTARFRPYASSKHTVTKGRYITSNDPRGYVPVYEYPLNGQWLMVDSDNGYVLWTGIWKALGNSKADIVKMVELQPELAPQLRRVRGGYLKIQGTWMPYEIALRLARRVAWPIREDLIPLFGPTFPSTCLSPDQPGYGQLVSTTGRRKSRRTTSASASASAPASVPVAQQQDAQHQHQQSRYTQGLGSQGQAGPSGANQNDTGLALLSAAAIGGGQAASAGGTLPYPGHHMQRDQNHASTYSPQVQSQQYHAYTRPGSPSGAYMHPHPQLQNHSAVQNQTQAQGQPHGQAQTLTRPGPSYAYPPPTLSSSNVHEYAYTQSNSQARDRERGQGTRQQQQQRYAPYPSVNDIHTHGHGHGHTQRYLSPDPIQNLNHPYPPLPPHGTPTHPRPIDSADSNSSEAATTIHARPPSRDHGGPIHLPPLSSLGHPPPPPPIQTALGGTYNIGLGLGAGPASAGGNSAYGSASAGGSSTYSLPPISSLDSPVSAGPDGSSAVLRRLKLDDEYVRACRPGSEAEYASRTATRRDAYSDAGFKMPSPQELRRRRSFSAPPLNAYGVVGSTTQIVPSQTTVIPLGGWSRGVDSERSSIYPAQPGWQADPSLNRQDPEPGSSGYSHDYAYPAHQQHPGAGLSSYAQPNEQRRSVSDPRNSHPQGPPQLASPLPSSSSYRGEGAPPHLQPDTGLAYSNEAVAREEGGSPYHAPWTHPTGDGEKSTARLPSRPW